MKCKSKIILCPGHATLVKHGVFVDGGVTAKALWDTLDAFIRCPLSKQWHIIKTSQKFYTFNGHDWEKQISAFISLYDELAAEYQNFSVQEETIKRFRTLSKSFSSLIEACSVNENSFGKISNAVI